MCKLYMIIGKIFIKIVKGSCCEGDIPPPPPFFPRMPGFSPFRQSFAEMKVHFRYEISGFLLPAYVIPGPL